MRKYWIICFTSQLDKKKKNFFYVEDGGGWRGDK